MEQLRPRGEKGLSKVTEGTGGTGLQASQGSGALPAEGCLRLLTSFRSVFIRSLESSMRLASMKSLYLSRTQ